MKIFDKVNQTEPSTYLVTTETRPRNTHTATANLIPSSLGLSPYCEETLTSQMYEKKYLLVSVYDSTKVVFETIDYSDKNFSVTFENKNLTNQDEQLLLRVAFYHFNESPLLKIKNSSGSGLIYPYALDLLNDCKGNNYLTIYTHIRNANQSDFCSMVKNYKLSELDSANPTLQNIMALHDSQHSCCDNMTSHSCTIV